MLPFAAARILRGKNKPEYVPHQDMGGLCYYRKCSKGCNVREEVY
jgi:ribosomal protein L13